MWEMDIKILRGRQLARYETCIVPRKDELICIDDMVYKVISVMYDYKIRYISIMVKEV